MKDHGLVTSPPQHVGIVGLGGLGHVTVKFAKAFGHHVSVISTFPSKESEAKVVDLVRRAVPLVLTAENDPIRDDLKKLQEKKEYIDVLANKQVRRILWSGLSGGIVTVSLFFGLTFWEFSWDVMEPIAFFTTSIGLVIGYAYFLFTSRDPSYQDFMKRLYFSRQRKLHKRYDFDVERFKELQCKCKTPLDAKTILKNRIGVDVDLDDTLHRD